MRLKDDTPKFSLGHKIYTGKYRKFEVTIIYAKNRSWYYCIDNLKDIAYNSLWNDNGWFDNKEDCIIAAQHKIDEVIKSANISKKME